MRTTRSRTRSAVGAAVWVAAAVMQSCAEPAPEGSIAITGVNVVDVAEGALVFDQTIVVHDGRILSIRDGRRPPRGAEVVDGSGRFAMPGLWDMHVHVRYPAAPELVFPQFLAHGVTGVRDMGSDCSSPDPGDTCVDTLREWGERIERGELSGPRLLATSSFPVNPPWGAVVSEEEARAIVQRSAERGVDLIKIYYRLSPEAFAWITAEARELGLDVGGHIPIRMTATEASNAGLNTLEHARDFLFDCFPGSADFRATTMSQNPPMEVMRSMVDDHDADVCDDVFGTFVRNDTWYVPTHVTRRMDAFADDPDFRNDPRSKYVRSDQWASWGEDADRMVALDPSPEGRRVVRGFYERGLEITGRAYEAGVRLVLGTDAGDTYVFYGSGAHDELGELVKAGLTPAQALRAGTLDAAELLGLNEEYGSLEVGKRADILLLRENPLAAIDNVRSIETVIFDGRVIDRGALDAMLREVERLVASFGG